MRVTGRLKYRNKYKYTYKYNTINYNYWGPKSRFLGFLEFSFSGLTPALHKPGLVVRGPLREFEECFPKGPIGDQKGRPLGEGTGVGGFVCAALQP